MNQNYKINVSMNALKFINKQDIHQKKRILSAIYRLPKGDVKKLKGYPLGKEKSQVKSGYRYR
jgi:mRNA interferase RelE/StbE